MLLTCLMTFTKTLKHIVISEKNYQILKNLGRAGDSFNDNIKKLQENLMVLELKGTKKTKPNTITDIGQIAWLRFFPIKENLEIIQKIFPNILISKIDEIINQTQNPDIKMIKDKYSKKVLKTALNSYHIEQNISSNIPFYKLIVDEIIDLSSSSDYIKTSFKRDLSVMHPSISFQLKQKRKQHGFKTSFLKNYNELEINIIDRVTFLFYYILIQSVLDNGYAGIIISEYVIKKLIEKGKENILGVTSRYLKLSVEITKKKRDIMKIIISNDTIHKIIEKNFEQLKKYENTNFQEISDFFIKK